MAADTLNQQTAGARGVPPNLDAQALADDLRRRVKGEVRFDDGSRALYATDASNYRQPPIGVVIPRDVEDVIETVGVARRHGAPVLSRGGGTSLAGQCCNTAVVMDFSKYVNRILELDPDRKVARVQPGVILDTLREAAEEHNLTFGPDPATHTHCTLGGMIGNNSCGIHALMAGKTADNIEELDVLLYDGTRLRVGRTSDDELEQIIRAGGRRGEIYGKLKALRERYAGQIRERYPDIPRRVSGYNLDQLLPENGFHVARALVGTEATCVTVLEATTRLVYSPPARSLLVLGYPDVFSAGDHVPQILEFGPVGLEGIDEELTGYMEKKGLRTSHLKLLPEGGGWLIAEFGGQNPEDAENRAREVMEALRKHGNAPAMKVYVDKHDRERVWEIRESGLGATAFVPGMPDTWPGWEDSAVPPDRVGEYLRDLRQLFNQYGYQCSLYGHFGQGCIHVRIDFDLVTPHGIAKYRRFVDNAADLVLRYGGSLSGEHGDGQARAELLPKMYGPDLVRAFGEFKAIWDPDGKMNPGKVVDPYPLTANLRLGADYNPARPQTHFSFHNDDFSFAHATLRCVGVGKCRRDGGGTMCPSYMVTHEEKHTTRGRAHLLFEMLQGEVITEGWRSEHVKEALDLCLACKGCKGDCPVNVDLATYKAEFLSHYYSGRLRPRSAYAFGLIMYWARLAALAPELANLVTQSPGLKKVAKWVAEVAPEREIPVFATETFKGWFRRREPRNDGKPPVILWPDTFTNHFEPEIARAAVEVLEDADRQVLVPQPWLCCGRPFYDYGMLNLAKRNLRRIVDALRPQIRAGIPVVGLEPSCVAVFRDELVNLFPHDQDARRLSQQTYTLGEFLEKMSYEPPRMAGQKALVQGHCHHKAIMTLDSEASVLEKLKLDYEIPESGCCGMAGSFGFEKGERYEVSVACGERVILPAARQADPDTLLIADGFSCRHQINEGAGRKPLHLAQVLQRAIHAREASGAESEPTAGASATGRRLATLAGTGVALAGGALAWRLSRRR